MPLSHLRNRTTHHIQAAPTATAATQISGVQLIPQRREAALLPPPPAVALAEIEPIVAVGGGAFTPFIWSEVSESAAKPTEGGLNRKTEYTFFCERMINGQIATCDSSALTRKVSPTIQVGALPPVLSSKNAPTHWDPLSEVSRKSAGAMGQLGPPNEMAMLTCVLHG